MRRAVTKLISSTDKFSFLAVCITSLIRKQEVSIPQVCFLSIWRLWARTCSGTPFCGCQHFLTACPLEGDFLLFSGKAAFLNPLGSVCKAMVLCGLRVVANFGEWREREPAKHTRTHDTRRTRDARGALLARAGLFCPLFCLTDNKRVLAVMTDFSLFC